MWYVVCVFVLVSTSALLKSATKEVRNLGIFFREGFPV